MENEIPEALYTALNDFIRNNQKWDQKTVMNSALSYFLFQNGCEDEEVKEKFLKDLF